MLNLDIDKLKQYIKPDALQKSLLIADIQRYIMSLESDNIEEIRDALINSNYLNDEYLIKRFIDNIFISCKYRGHRVLDYVTLVYEIYRSPKITKREYLKKCIFEIHQSDCRQPWRLLFIWGCTHLYNSDEIYSYIQAYLRKFETIDDEQMNLFLYFAPYIEKYDKPIFDRILAEMRLRKSRMNLPLIYHPFLNQFKQLRENNWLQHKSAVSDGFTNDCLIYAIRHDEYELFLSYAQSATFDPNQRINESLLIRYPALMNRMTILEWASFHGARRTFDYLLEHGADPYLTDEIGLNLMHFSVLGGHHYMITKCQELGFDFTNGVVPLVAEMYRTNLFQYLYQNNLFKIDEAFTTTGTVFHRCATANNIYLMLFCIEKDIDVNVRDKFDLTPLYYAVKNMSLDAVLLILNHKDVVWNATDKFNDTPLHGAAKAGNVEIFKALLEHRQGMLNTVDVHNRTPLVYAIEESKIEIVECCLEYNDAQINLPDDTGRTPIFHACERGSIECFKKMIEANNKKKKDDQIGIENLIDFNCRRKDGVSILHYCTQNNKLEFLRILLQQPEVEPNITDGEGRSPLHIAAKFGFVEVFQALIANEKTDTNSRSEYGMTPLLLAVRYSQKEVVEILLKCDRVDVNLKTNIGLTPKDLAMQMGLADITSIFNYYKKNEIVL